MKHAFVFPGQGSQFPGMGSELARAFPVAREVLEEVDETLGQDLSGLMARGPLEELTLTANAQPALMAHSLAAFRVMEKELGTAIRDAAFVAGHSLGEYSALCAAGAVSLADTARLLRIRGDAMQAAMPPGTGAMAALIGAGIDDVLRAVSSVPDGGVCEIANDNAPGQVVISGHRERVEAVCAGAGAFGIKLTKMLPVSAPFHSPLMQPAADRMEEALAGTVITAPAVAPVSNVTAEPVTDPDVIRRLLVKQITQRVRWTQSVTCMISAGCTHFFEIGTGRVLCGLVRRIDRRVSTANIGTPAEIESFAALPGTA